MIIKVKIADSTAGNTFVERQAYIDGSSVVKNEVLTSSPDSFKFYLKKFGNKTYTPLIGEEVKFEVDSVLKFGGYIVDIDQNADALKNTIKITCKDYTHILDRILVSKTYEAVTANAIISDLITNFAPAGFTISNVVAPVTINKIVFNYLTISQALTKLAGMLGVYDWYVDADKDIHFFLKGTIVAPFEINDSGGNFAYSSLTIKRTSTQIKNKIIIRGGTVEGDLFTDKAIADGQQRTFFVGYNLVGITVLKGASAQTVGIDGKDSETSFDCLYNPDNGLIRYPDATKPTSGVIITYSGKPTYPLITQKSDLSSIAKYGTFEFVIVDKSIKSKNSASQRATAELLKYSVPQATINFSTTKDGLVTGQYIRVNSTGHNIINEYFKITNITQKMRTPDSFIYQVEGVLSENIDLVDLLKKIITDSQSDKIDISQNEIVDRLYSSDETISMVETVVASKVHNPQAEVSNITEVAVGQAPNYPTEFVVGNYIPDAIDQQTAISNSWYDLKWTRRVKVTIDKTKIPSTQTDFPLGIDLSLLNSAFWGKVLNGGGDIRVTTSDGITECAREIVSCDTSNSTGSMWVKIPSVSSSVDTVIYIYIGNSIATDYSASATYGSQNVWASGARVYHLNDLTSSTVKDSGSGGYNGTKAGGANAPVEIDGKFGKGQSFDGVSNTGYIGINQTAVDVSQPHTFIALIYVRSTPDFNTNGIIDKWLSNTGVFSNGMRLVIGTNLNLYAENGYSNAGSNSQSVIHSAISLNTWLFVAITYDGTNIKVFKNNTNVSAVQSATPINRSGVDLRIGNTHHSNGTLDGIIDEVRVYAGTALSVDRLLAEYNNQIGIASFMSYSYEYFDPKRQFILDGSPLG